MDTRVNDEKKLMHVQHYAPVIEAALAFNRSFVKEEAYIPYQTDKYPAKKLAIVSCMDTRLTELLHASLGLKNGDAKIIKVAGAEISEPFGAVMRSLLIAVCELHVNNIMVIAHTNCGAQHMNGAALVEKMKALGVSPDAISLARHCGINFDTWLAGFGNLKDSVRRSVAMIRNCPVFPSHVGVQGFIIDTTTGKLTPVDGSKG